MYANQDWTLEYRKNVFCSDGSQGLLSYSDGSENMKVWIRSGSGCVMMYVCVCQEVILLLAQ